MRLKHLLSVFLTLLTLGVGQMWGAADETITFSSVCSADEDLQAKSKNGTNFSVYFNKGTNSNKPVYKTTGSAVRVYGGGYFTVSSTTKTIKKIELTFGSGDGSNAISTNVGSYSSSTWTGTATSVKFTVGGSSGHRRLASVAVTYESGCTGTKLGTPVVTAEVSNQQIKLTWPAVSNASSYQLKWNGGDWAAATSPVTKTGLTNGTAYTYQVKAIGNGSTYCDGDASAEASATPNVSRTITYYDKDGQHTTSLTDGTNIATALNALYGVGGPTSCNTTNYNYFVGWKDGEISGTASSVTLLSTEVVNATTAAKSYYAVWSDKDPSSGSWTVASSIAANDVIVLTYVSGNTKKEMTSISNSIGNVSDFATSVNGTYPLTVVVGNSNGSFSFKNGDNYVSWSSGNSLTTSTTKDNSSSWTVSISNNIATITNVGTTSRKMKYNTSSPRICCYDNNNASNVTIYKQASVSANYITTCCSPLGSINGSVSWSNATTAVVSWDNLDHVSSWTVKYKTHAAGDYSTLAGDQSTAAGRRSVTITGLTPCTNYDFQIIANPASGYCDKDETIEDSQTHNWTVTKTGVTNVTAESLSAIPATTCASGFNATIVAASGYDLPGTITVTGANHTWNQATGALTISNVTGNVVITITPTEAQCTPLTAPSVSVSGKDYPYDAVTLSWTAVEHADGYTVEIYDGETKIEGDDLDGGADSYTIGTTLAANKTYTYKVKATYETPATYCPSEWATDNFTTADYPTVKLFYNENGELSAGVDQQILTDFTLPNEAAECSKTFIGWTTQSSYSHASAAPDPFYEKGATFQIPTNANCTLYAVYADVVEASTNWTRVTAVNTLTAGGTFIMGYEATSNSGVIVPMQNSVSSNFAYSGDGTNASNSNTIDMGNVNFSTAKYEISVVASTVVNGAINIKFGDKFLGNENEKNCAKLYTEEAATTAFTPTIGENDVFTLEIKANTGKTDNYKFLKFNTDPNYPRFAVYKTTPEKIVFYKKNVTEASVTNYVTICQGKVGKPVISGVAEGTTYEEAKTITITSATTGATIYYTTDGTEPTTSSNAYSAPFEVSANGDYTIRAIAVKADMVNSDEATAVSFTLDLPFTTIASFIAAEPSTAKKLVFTESSNARVLAYNKNRIYIQDGTGAMFLYNTGSNNEGHGKTWASGKKIVGTLTGTYMLANNMPRMTVTDFGATDVTDDAIELPTPIEVDALATNFASNVCKLVTISGVSIRSESVADNNTINMTKNDVTYNIYNAFNALTGHKLPLGTTSCTVTGILGQSNSGTTLQLMPISADGISTNGAEAVLPVLSVTGSTNSAVPFEVATNKMITFTPNSNFDAVYAINDGEEAAVTGSSNVTITDEENATKVTIRATREYYTTKEVSYYYRANSALIEYDITKSSMSHGSATIQNAQGDAITYAVGGATVTLVANPAEHYHWVSWEVTAGGEPVTVTNNTFEMPNAAVTVSATFEEDDYATVAFAKGNASVTGDAPASQKVYVDENATMPGKGSMILSSHNFAGWKLGDNAVLNAGDHYTVTAEDHEAGTITFEAQWEPYPWASAGKWELVTSASEITVNPTTYVIFADTLSSGNTACGLTQNENNRAAVSVTKTDNLLTWTGADPAIFIVEKGKDQGTLAFYDAINNNYIHAASSANKQNYLRSNTDKNTDGAAWTINAIRPNGGATITADTYSHNLLNLNGNLCAAYTSPQKGLAIYKFVGGNYYNIAYAKGTEDEVRNMPEGHVTDENGEAAIKENTPIRVGYTFTGWKDQDENVYTYNDGQIYAFTKNVTLTAQWEEQTDKYTVSYDANGSSDAVPAEAAYFENAEVTVAGAVSKEGFVFMGWECNGRVYTAGSKFYMPATDMPMVAKYAHGATYDNMTKVSNVCSIESHDAPEGSEAVFTNSYTTAKQITKNSSMTLTLSGYTGYTIEGVKLSTGSNNTSGQGTLSITIGGVEVATDANADKWYNGVHHYGSNNGTDFENVLVSMNPKTVKYGEDIVITIAASESSLYCQSFTILYDLLPVEVENTTTIEARDLAAGTAVTIHDGGTLNVNADKTLDNLTVEAGGEVVLDANKLTVVGTFTLETTMASGASGQLTGATASNFATNGPAYIDITLGAGGRADHWHAITVPFPVDAINGIYDLDGNKLNNEEHYAIMEYLGNVRAQGKYGWKKYRKTLVPGTFYLMTVDGGRTTYRFMKTADGALVAGNSKEIFEYAKSGEGQTTDAGWNGVGNPTLVYGKVNAEVQVLDPVSYTYIKKDANSTNFVVGTPFFYQADGAGSISMLTADAGANYAPARVATNGIEKIKVSFGNEAFTDYLDISASEEALNEYQIGKDLVKMTMTNTPSVAQIFGNAYNAKLCMVYAPMVNDKATFDLTLYAPAAGTYTIAAPSMENATLYLTKNGRIYWNLTMGACELDLNQGQNNEYGLVLRAEAPAVTTGVENGELLNGENGVQKVVIDEHVYILRGGEMYDMTGKMVK